MSGLIRTVGILIYRGKEVLLVRHEDAANHVTGTYGLPAGKLRSGESDKGAAIRELLEETGLRATRKSLVELPKEYYATIEQKEGTKKFSFKVFVCKEFSGEPRGTEETTPEWVSISDAGRFNLLANTGKAIKDGLIYR